MDNKVNLNKTEPNISGLRENKPEKPPVRKTPVFVLAVLILLIIAGMIGIRAVLKNKQDKDMQTELEHRLSVAEANALQYVRDKYGFEAESWGADKYFCSWEDATAEELKELFAGTEQIPMTLYDGVHDFNVLVYWDRESAEGCDDYQVWDMRKWVVETLYNHTGGVMDLMDIGNSSANRTYIAKDKLFADGNFTELGIGDLGRIFCCCSGHNFEDPIFEELAAMGFDVYATGFYSDMMIGEYRAHKYSLGFSYLFEDDAELMPMIPYASGRRSIVGGVDKTVLFEPVQLDDFQYYSYDMEELGGSVSVSDTKTVEHAFADSGRAEQVQNPLNGKEYYAECDKDHRMYIYYQIDPGEKNVNIYLASAAPTKDGYTINLSDPYIVGEYAVFMVENEANFIFVKSGE